MRSEHHIGLLATLPLRSCFFFAERYYWRFEEKRACRSEGDIGGASLWCALRSYLTIGVDRRIVSEANHPPGFSTRRNSSNNFAPFET